MACLIFIENTELYIFTPAGMNFMDAEVADINEEEYRQGILDIKKFGTLKVPDSSMLFR